MVPNLFSKHPIPEKLPKDMEREILRLSKIKDKEEFLKEAFLCVTDRYRANRFCSVIRFFDLFRTDINFLWRHHGYFHCTSLNFFLRIILVKSSLIKEEDIELKPSNAYFLWPHQYLRVHLGRRQIDMDPFAYPFGIVYGDHGHGFHFGSFFPVKERLAQK